MDSSPSVSRAGQSHGFSLDSEEREGEEPAAKDPRERSWERKTPAEERRKRREDSEPRLHMACDDNPDGQEPPGADKSGEFYERLRRRYSEAPIVGGA